MIDISKGIQESQTNPNFTIGPDTKNAMDSLVKNYNSISK